MKLDKEARTITAKWYDLLKEQIHNATKEFHAKLTSSENVLYPENCRFLYQDCKVAIVVIEQKPQTRSIYISRDYDVDDDVGDDYPHKLLSFPYVISIIILGRSLTDHRYNNYTFKEIKIAYRNEPLSSLQDMLYRHNLPNPAPDLLTGESDNMTVCMGYPNYWHNKINKNDNLPVAIEKVMNHFWLSRWTGRITYGITSSKKWMNATKKDPPSIPDINWTKVNPLEKVIDGLSRYTNKTNLSLLHDQIWKKVGRLLTPEDIQSQIVAIIEKETSKAMNDILKNVKNKKAKGEIEKAINEMLKK